MSYTEEIADIDVIHCMQERGGSFVKALAHAALHADARNRERLKLAFVDYWGTYYQMAKALQELGR